MDLETLIVTVFCKVDDWLKEWLKGKRLRQRGPQPTLSDSEVLTMEIVGEFLGIETDKGIYQYFRTHWSDWFPGLRQVHRTTFARQAANLWAVKYQLWQHLLSQITFDPHITIVDSFPVPVCRFARAYRCRIFAGEAAYGYDEMEKQTFYGFRAHLLIGWPGVIVGLILTPANVHDLEAAEEFATMIRGWMLGDRNDWSPELIERVKQRGVYLLAPFKSAKREKRPWPRWLTQMRRRVETVISQLTGRYHAKKTWARDRWHLSSRWWRKILSHTFAVWTAQRLGLPSPLQFADLITT